MTLNARKNQRPFVSTVSPPHLTSAPVHAVDKLEVATDDQEVGGLIGVVPWMEEMVMAGLFIHL